MFSFNKWKVPDFLLGVRLWFATLLEALVHCPKFIIFIKNDKYSSKKTSGFRWVTFAHSSQEFELSKLEIFF